MKTKYNRLFRPEAVSVDSYSKRAVVHLGELLEENRTVMKRLVRRIVKDVSSGKSLFVFGSGHSSLFPLELYHRAGGVSFVVPLVADFLMPQSGPPVVRAFERQQNSAIFLLNRGDVKKGEMLWICSQSGINAAGVELALEARRRGVFTVAFSSKKHSQSVASRHPSGKRLFEVCDEVVDLMGEVGDASIQVGSEVHAGPLSSLGSTFLGHSILVAAAAQLEAKNYRCVYTSVNTPEGEKRNLALEKKASRRDPLLR